MKTGAKADRLHQELLEFLFSAHARIITEQDGAAFAERVVEIRRLTERLRGRYATADEKKLVSRLRRMSAGELREVARAFTLLFWLLNLAEERRFEQERGVRETQSFRSLFERTKKAGVSGEQIASKLGDLRATIVLTAHPTEALRWSLRETLSRIDALLGQREEAKGTERAAIEEEILAEITGLWLSTTLRTRKPTPIDEVRYAIHVLQEVLVHAVPKATTRPTSGPGPAK